MYYFIVNPNACQGFGGKLWKRLERRVKQAGVDYKVRLAAEPGEAGAYTVQVTGRAAETQQVIVAVGDDGTFNEILEGLAFDRSVTLGYVPVSPACDLARGLHFSRSAGRCLERILNPTAYRYLDYGIMSYQEETPKYRRFLVSCGVGLDAVVCHFWAERHSKQRWMMFRFRAGRAARLIVGLRKLVLAKPVKGYLVLDGVRKVEFNHIYFVSAHIHGFEGGGFRFAPGADGSDGLLEVCVAHASNKIDVGKMMFDALLGSPGRHRGVHWYSCREAQIHLDERMPFHVDGDVCGFQTDIRLGCVEKKLRMIV
ncbi:MAG: diacylglycerol kinase family lipid kinase [Clostridiales bacterium]|nr:diacylglycerol kinase family lipid kinase [Clostridiales bacterium]